MFCTSIHFQFFNHCIAQRTFWQHTFYSFFQCATWEFVLHFAESTLVNTTWEARVTVVFFAFKFVTCHTQFVCIDNDDVITSINVWRVFRFMFATQAACNFGCNTTQNFIFCVNYKPFALHFMRFR